LTVRGISNVGKAMVAVSVGSGNEVEVALGEGRTVGVLVRVGGGGSVGWEVALGV
jgi:hypothetical protein